jgi:hypothetical protein
LLLFLFDYRLDIGADRDEDLQEMSAKYTPLKTKKLAALIPCAILRRFRFATALLFGLIPFLASCAKPDVKYSDLRPATTATISEDTVTVHLGSDLVASACWTRPKARVEGQTVYVIGYRTMREQSREFLVRLPAYVASQPVDVIWIDPDGSHVSVPITK